MLADGFPRKRLGELVQQVRRPITPSADCSYGLIGVRWYAAGTHLHDTITGDRLQASTLWRVKRNDVIYNKMWTSKGAFAVVSSETTDLFGTSEYPTFSTRPNSSSDYLAHAFNQPRFWQLAEAWTNGTTERARLNPKDFLRLPIPMPEITEQRAIVSVLSAIDETLAHTTTLIQAITEALSSTLMWSTSVGHPASVPLVKLGSIIESTKYGTSAKCDDNAAGYPVLRIPNVLSGGIDKRQVKYASLPATEASKFALRDRDLLAVRTNGNPDYVGRMAIISDLPNNTLFASYLIRIRIDISKALPEFVWLCSNTYPLRDTLTAAARTSAGNFNINTDGVRSALVPLPSMEHQRRIVAAANTLRLRIAAETAYLSMLRQTRAALAQELLSGRVRLPDGMIARYRDAPSAAA